MQLRLPIDLDTPDAPAPPAPQPRGNPLCADQLVGSWCGGERFVTHDNRLEPAHVWFHLRGDRRVFVSVRYRREQQPRVVTGSWWLEGNLLLITIGNHQVHSSVSLADGVMRWAGEVLIRMPDGLEHPVPSPGDSTASDGSCGDLNPDLVIKQTDNVEHL